MKPFKPAIISFVQTLRSLGFNSYPQYLRSDLWLSIKHRVMERDGYECGLCLARGRVVHHLKYNEETMKGETLDWLLTLCTKCHKSIEFDGNKDKSSLAKANRRLCMLGGLPYDKVKKFGMDLDLSLVPEMPKFHLSKWGGIREGPERKKLSKARRNAIKQKNKQKSKQIHFAKVKEKKEAWKAWDEYQLSLRKV